MVRRSRDPGLHALVTALVMLRFICLACEVCNKLSLDRVWCSRCGCVAYCSEAHCKEGYELHSQHCQLPQDVATRYMTAGEHKKHRQSLIELAKTRRLPVGRLRSSQQRHLTSWSQWFFLRMSAVCLSLTVRTLSSLMNAMLFQSP
jgi:hypothetical protein